VETVEIRVGDRLLRPWRPTDAEAVTRASQDPVLRYRAPSFPSPYTLADGRQFVTELAPRGWADRTQEDGRRRHCWIASMLSADLVSM
jgi:hypothetical protein